MTENTHERLRIAMKHRGIGDAPELSRLVGINVSTVRSNLNGHRAVSKENAPKYAARLKVSPEWLLYGRGEGPGDQAVPETAGALGIIDDLVPTLKVARSQPIVTPDGATGLALLSATGEAIAVAVDRDAIEQIRKNLRSLELFLGRRS